MDLDIVLRTCARRNAHPGTPRVVEAAKPEIVSTCLRSLLASTAELRGASPEFRLRLVIVDDRSDEETIRRMRELVDASGLAATWVPVSGTGNGASLRTTYEWARTNARDLIYFVEDDYLHEPSCLREMLASRAIFSAVLGPDIVLLPADFSDRYQLDHVYPSNLVLGSHRHWRSVLHSTGTFLINRSILERNWDRYLEFTRLDQPPYLYEDDTINLIYRSVPCLSPVPTLAHHLGAPESFSPFSDWKPLWEKYQVRSAAQPLAFA